MMDSSLNNNFLHQNNQPSSGLLRFRSVPSTFLANFNDNGISGNDSGLNFQQFEEKPGVRVRETTVNYSNSGQSYSGLPPHYPRQSSGASSSVMDSSFGLVYSIPMNHNEQVKRVDASLARQSSSPAGLFGNLSIQNDNGAKIVGTYAGMNGTDREGSPRLKSQLSIPSRGPSSLGMLAQVSQVGNESMDPQSRVNRKHGNSNGDARFYSSPAGYSYSSWSDSQFPENFTSSPKRDEKLFSSPQNGEIDSRVHLLSHHLSLPKTSAEMVAMEKFLHYQDSVPCKIRAKRGCATHPRSIAERVVSIGGSGASSVPTPLDFTAILVRRTRISERMRKLQDLVPNMDKQTNTADMLDLAVDYIKELQRQYKTLSNNRANCKCSSRQKALQNQII